MQQKLVFKPEGVQDNEYWTSRVDIVAFLDSKCGIIHNRIIEVPSTRYPGRIVCTWIYNGSIELQRALSEFRNPLGEGTRIILNFAEAQQRARATKASIEKRVKN